MFRVPAIRTAPVSQELAVTLLVLGMALAAPAPAPAPVPAPTFADGFFTGSVFNGSAQMRVRRSISQSVPGRSFSSYLPNLQGEAGAGGDSFSIDSPSYLEYEPLCKERRVRVELRNLDAGVDYYPAQYDEVYCESSLAEEAERFGSPDKCAHPGFKCVQQYKTLFVIRRDIKQDCYLQKATLRVPSGCECMWPARQLGGAGEHY